MNAAQRRALPTPVRKVWRRWFNAVLADGAGEDAARARADIEAEREIRLREIRLREIDDAETVYVDETPAEGGAR